MATRKTQKRATAKAAMKKTAAKRTAGRKVVKLAAGGKAKRAAVRRDDLPKPSTKPWGKAGNALDGVRILDFTPVQSGPTCTPLLAYMGADGLKIQRPRGGAIPRGQLRYATSAANLH